MDVEAGEQCDLDRRSIVARRAVHPEADRAVGALTHGEIEELFVGVRDAPVGGCAQGELDVARQADLGSEEAAALVDHPARDCHRSDVPRWLPVRQVDAHPRGGVVDARGHRNPALRPVPDVIGRCSVLADSPAGRERHGQSLLAGRVCLDQLRQAGEASRAEPVIGAQELHPRVLGEGGRSVEVLVDRHMRRPAVVPDPRVVERADHVLHTVGRHIVPDHELPVGVVLLEHTGDRPGHPIGVVVDRHEDRDRGRHRRQDPNRDSCSARRRSTSRPAGSSTSA